MILPVPSQIARTQGSDAVIYYQVDQQTIAEYPRGGAATSPTYRYFWASSGLQTLLALIIRRVRHQIGRTNNDPIPLLYTNSSICRIFLVYWRFVIVLADPRTCSAHLGYTNSIDLTFLGNGN